MNVKPKVYELKGEIRKNLSGIHVDSLFYLHELAPNYYREGFHASILGYHERRVVIPLVYEEAVNIKIIEEAISQDKSTLYLLLKDYSFGEDYIQGEFPTYITIAKKFQSNFYIATLIHQTFGRLNLPKRKE